MRGDAQASGAAGQANSNSNAFFGNASSLYGNLAPTLQSEVAHPAGYAPQDLASMETGALQGAGGTQAAAVGQGGLYAARTRNKGGAAAAIADSSRSAGHQLSRNLMGVRSANADLKQKQMQEGIAGLGNLYSTNAGASNNALGQVAANSNANTNAVNSSWDWSRDLFAPILQAGGSAAGGYLSRPSN